MEITRRQLLSALGVLAGAGALGAAGLGWSWYDRPPGEGLQVLSDDEHGFVQAFAEAWMPAGGTPALSGADARLGDFFDELIATAKPEVQTQLKLLAQALDDWTVPRRGGRFQHLDLSTRIEVLDGWLHTDMDLFRSAVFALVALIALGWTLHPEVTAVVRPYFGCTYGP